MKRTRRCRIRGWIQALILAFMTGCSGPMSGSPILGSADTLGRKGGFGLSGGVQVHMQGEDDGFSNAGFHNAEMEDLLESTFFTGLVGIGADHELNINLGFGPAGLGYKHTFVRRSGYVGGITTGFNWFWQAPVFTLHVVQLNDIVLPGDHRIVLGAGLGLLIDGGESEPDRFFGVSSEPTNPAAPTGIFHLAFQLRATKGFWLQPSFTWTLPMVSSALVERRGREGVENDVYMIRAALDFNFVF